MSIKSQPQVMKRYYGAYVRKLDLVLTLLTYNVFISLYDIFLHSPKFLRQNSVLASCVGTVPTYKRKLSCKILVSHNDYYDVYSEWVVMPCGLVDGCRGLWDLLRPS